MARNLPSWEPSLVFLHSSLQFQDVGDELGQDQTARSSSRFPAGLEEQRWKSCGCLVAELILDTTAPCFHPSFCGKADCSSRGFIPVFVGKPTVPHLLPPSLIAASLGAALQAWRVLQRLLQRLRGAPQRLGTPRVTHPGGTACVPMEKGETEECSCHVLSRGTSAWALSGIHNSIHVWNPRLHSEHLGIFWDYFCRL